MKLKRGQTSIETIVFVSFILIIFISVTLFTVTKNSEISNTKDYLNRKNECLRISNIVSGVYSAGDGTVVNTYTNSVLTIYNHTYVGIRDLKNETQVKVNNTIAALVSEAGESTQTFYNILTSRLNPTWYKVCFDDIDGVGCQSTGTDVNYSLIPMNLSDLICNDLNKYNVVYLEDPHIQYNVTCPGNRDYMQILQNWINAGNTLILSEHPRCREQASGTYSLTSYQCNPPGSNSDVWDLFSQKIHQRGGNFGNNLTIVINPDPNLFPNLHLNDNFDFQEDSYIEQLNTTRRESESLSLSSGYASSTNCVCSSPSGGSCIRSTASLSSYANATWVSNLTGNYELRVRYCGESDGNDTWNIYKNGQTIDNWITSPSEPSWKDRSIQGVSINSGDSIKLSCKRGTSNSNCRSDYIEFVPSSSSFVTVGKYDADAQPAIAYWNYGNGKVFYFGDFEVSPNIQSAYSTVIADLIENSYFLLLNPTGDEELCFPSSYIQSIGQFSGNIRIKNINNNIIIEDV